MPDSTDLVSLCGGFALPGGLACVRCAQPLTYADAGLVCEGCDTIYELLPRRPPPDSCPWCGGPVAWMGAALVCSPVPHPSRCSHAFVAAPPAPPRVSACCSRLLPWSNRASLCFPCALRAYADIRPGAARVLGLDGACDADWREHVGFSLADDLWGSSGPVAGHPGYGTEFYAVGTASAAYLEGQLVCALPPWISGGGPAGTVWLARILCPSGMAYEVAFPAGRLGDPLAASDARQRRAAPLPERIVRTRGVAAGTLERELRAARAIVNALPRHPGGATAIDPDEDAAAIVVAIEQVRADGVKPSQERVAQLIYPYAKKPRDSLKPQLERVRTRSGLTWNDLLRRAR